MITVDIFEPEDMPATLSALGVKAVRKSLKSGDYSFNGKIEASEEEQLIGVERKRVNDYATSITTGRLEQQVRKMLDYYALRYVVVEGYHKVVNGKISIPYGRSWRELSLDESRWMAMQHALEHFYGARVYYTSGLQTTSRLLVHLYKYWRRPFSSHHSLDYLDVQTQSKFKERVGGAGCMLVTPPPVWLVATRVPGIDSVLATRLAKKFKTVRALISSEEQWKTVKGIGGSKVQSMKSFFERSW